MTFRNFPVTGGARQLHLNLRLLRKYSLLARGNYAGVFGHIDDDLAGQIRAHQLSEIVQSTPSTMIATIVNNVVLIGTLGRSGGWPLILWTVVLTTLVALIASRGCRSYAMLRHVRVSEKGLRRVTRNALIFGLIWGAAPVLFFPEASVTARLAITCICAGMIGGGAFVFASVPSAAIAFVTPIALGSIWTLANLDESKTSLVIVLVVCYWGVLVQSVLLHAHRSLRQVISKTRVEHSASHDTLTNLDNRTAFKGMLTDAMSRLERANELSTLFLVDIDALKQVNERYGRATGDALLVDAADRLRGLKRRSDRIARFNGDQFAIIAPGLAGAATIRAYASRISREFDAPFAIDGLNVNISVCIGVMVLQEKGGDVDVELRNMELALQMAQRGGRGSCYFFGPQDDAAKLERSALERDLRFALTRGELFLNFQPMLRLSSDKIVGFEALVRWRHPTRGLISPADFIPIAETTGIIDTIGPWVLREACNIAANWPPNIRVCVNVSPFQLRDRALCTQVAEALAEAHLEPHQLELEVTETVLITDDPLPIEILQSLRKSGVGLALDDFGIGYSSLNYLRRLPFDRIKIDRSFVAEITSNRESAAIVKSVIGLASELGMDVIAEGIETIEQLEMLRRLNCPEVQGYLIGKPMHEVDIAAYLAKGIASAAA